MNFIKDLDMRKVGRHNIRHALFECDVCSSRVEKIKSNGLRAKSCGCIPKGTRHGGQKTRLYKTWQNMKTRCDNENSRSYKDYGGRGITYINEWKNFEPFRDWALNNGYSDSLTIDRIDVDGNYSPSNCRFVTHLKQMQNQRRKENLTGYIGVRLDKRSNKFYAQVCINYKKIHIGTFDTAREAAMAFDDYCNLNNLEQPRNFASEGKL